MFLLSNTICKSSFEELLVFWDYTHLYIHTEMIYTYILRGTTIHTFWESVFVVEYRKPRVCSIFVGFLDESLDGLDCAFVHAVQMCPLGACVVKA